MSAPNKSCIYCDKPVRPMSTDAGFKRTLARLERANFTPEYRAHSIAHARDFHQKFNNYYPRFGYFCTDKCAVAWAVITAKRAEDAGYDRTELFGGLSWNQRGGIQQKSSR